MACRCSSVTVIVDPGPKTCSGCLKAVSLRVGCDGGPLPCGNTQEIDLAEYNDTTACDGCDAIYTVHSYDTAAFASVTITSAGLLEYETTDLYERYKEYDIIYDIDCPCSILSASGRIKVCMKHPCDHCDSDEVCNPCTGDCDPLDPEILIDGTPEIIIS